MFDFISAVCALSLVSYFIQSRFNAIDSLRTPRLIITRIQNSPRIQIAIAISIIMTVVLYFMWPIILGFTPIRSEHHVHILKIKILSEQLSEGHLRGWSQKIFAGYPYGYFYSPIADLMSIVVKYLSFYSLSISQAYSVTLVMVHLTKGLSGFILGYRIFGIGVGLLAGLLAILGPPFSNGEGRSWFLENGAWVADFSIALQVIGLSYLRELWTSPTKKSFFIFAFFSGLALLIHPISIIVLGLISCSSFVTFIATQNIERRVLYRATSRYCTAVTVAVLIASYFLVPFFYLSQSRAGVVTTWYSIDSLSQKVANLNLFGAENPIIIILGCFATILLSWSNKFWTYFLGITILLSCLVFSSDFFTWFPFLKDIPFISHLNLADGEAFIKCFFYLGSAYLAVKVLKAIYKLEDMVTIESNKMRLVLRTIVTSALLSMIVLPVIKQTRFSSPPRTLQYNWSLKEEKDIKKLASWLKTHVRSSADIPIRTGFLDTDGRLALFDIYQYTNLALHNLETTTGTNFHYKSESKNHSLLSYLNIRYLVSTRELSASKYTRRKKIGDFYIFENKDWRRSSPWRVMHGSGNILNLKIKDDIITFNTSANSTGKAMLFITQFPNWTLTIDGKEASIEGQPFQGIQTTNFMTFELKEGQYKIVFTRGWLEWLSIALSILGIILLISILTINRVSFRVL